MVTDVEYDGNTLKIYAPGRRPLTPYEQTVYDNRPRDDEQFEIDMLTDTNVMYHRCKQ